MPSHYFAFQALNLPASVWKNKALCWATQYKLVAFYEHNGIAYNYDGFENILAVSNQVQNSVNPEKAFESLPVCAPADSLLCGIFSYDLKNQSENLISDNPDFHLFPLSFFFQPEIYFLFTNEGFTVYHQHPAIDSLISQISNGPLCPELPKETLTIKPRVTREAYIQNVLAIQQHILDGDIYEMNYCMEFYAEAVNLNPAATFWALNQKSPMPFAGFFKLEDKYLLAASPERFLKKAGSKLITQPIKGTVKRGQNLTEDLLLRQQLETNEKEIAENMMIMDLARNDLNKSCKTGSVTVEEMFKVYSFQQVFQMITTVTGEIRDNCSGNQALSNAFPMGSMTGAPKIRAMQLIDQYEITRRGLYSGSFGYIKSNGDFDFNVVIRSLQYNAHTGYTSFMVGSAITYDALPEQEYDECLLKAQALLEILTETWS